MADVLVFHHALGLTDGVRSFADELREAGHVVHTPDVYDGETFAVVEDGVAHARELGFGKVFERSVQAADGLPDGLVYVGFSLGAMPAQKLAQTRPGAGGAVLAHSCAPPSEFGGGWPDGVPAQIHIMEGDPWAAEGDLDAARGFAADVDAAELFLYPGDKHLFADESGPDYDAEADALFRRRVLAFLDSL